MSLVDTDDFRRRQYRLNPWEVRRILSELDRLYEILKDPAKLRKIADAWDVARSVSRTQGNKEMG